MRRLIWLFVIVSIFLVSWFVGSSLQHQDEVITQPMIVTSCHPVGGDCEVYFSDEILKFQLSSPVVTMMPFTAKVVTQAEITEIYLQFHMKDMDMGVQRYKLIDGSDGVWQSEIILPVCSLGRSDWIATLDVKHKGEWWRGEFGFAASSQK